MTMTSASDAFGNQVRYWRRARGLSQLALALEAGTTPRHPSFLETGRSRPGLDVVLRLAEALAVPLRERNRLLAAAGLPHSFDEQDIDAPGLAQFRAVVDRMLAAHEPFPGFVFDRHFNIVGATPTGDHLLAAGPERNMVRLLFAPDGAWRELLDNWEEIAAYSLAQLQHDALRFPHDPLLRELSDLALRSGIGTIRSAAPTASPRLRLGEHRVDTISVIARFSSPREIVIEELRIELLYPADVHAEQVLRQLAPDAQDPHPPSADSDPFGSH